MRGVVLGLALGAALAQEALAGSGEAVRKSPPLEEAAAASPRLPLSPREAARRAQVQFGGRVLAVKPNGEGFSVKLLKNGEVRSVHITP